MHTVAQYLATVPDATATATFGARYVFGGLDQTEVAIPLRVNLALSPRLSLQLYTQALLSAGDYPAIKELARAAHLRLPGVRSGRGHDRERSRRSPPTSSIPTAAGPARSFRLADPDFNLKSLRANAVLRWEFRPGSAAYVVWTQRRQNRAHPGDHSFGRDLGDLFGSPADDVFMVKVAWWLGR